MGGFGSGIISDQPSDPGCDPCRLLFCDPKNRDCIQTPEFRFQISRRRENRLEQLAEARSRPRRYSPEHLKTVGDRGRINLKNANIRRSKIKALGFGKYDGRKMRHLKKKS